MSVDEQTLRSRDYRMMLFAVILPTLVLALLYYFGLMRLVRLAVMGGVATAVGVFLFLRPREAVYFLAFYTYSGLAFLVPFPAAIPMTAAVLGAALFGFLRGDENRLRDPLFWWAAGFFVLIALQSMLVAHHIDIAFLRLFSYIKAFVLVFLVVQFVRTPEHLRSFALAVFAGAVGTILIGILAFKLGLSTDINMIGSVQLMRFSGVHPDPNDSAAYMCAALPLGLFAIKYAANGARRALYVLGVVILVVGIFSTYSRGAFFPLGIVIVAAVARELHSRKAYIGFSILLALALLLGPRYYWERVFALREIADNVTQDWSVFLRWRALQTAWQLFLDHPIMGIGIGNFVERGATNVWVRMVVHNSYMEVLVGTGIFGLVSFVALLWSGMRQAIRGASYHWRRAPEWMQSLSYYFAVSLVAAAVAAVFLTIMYRYLLWIPVAAGLVVGNLLDADRSGEKRAPERTS